MVDVPVQDVIKNTFVWHNKNGYKPGKTYNLFNYFTSIEDSHAKYLHYQMSTPLSVQTQYDSPCKSDNPQPFYHFHQDSIITQKSTSVTPIRFSPRMGSNAINYARSTTTNRISIASNMSPINSFNIDQSISKISAIFPTVTESHIKVLLNKYHNREALVISALQVEKHPIATPGPYTPPSISRHYMLQANPSPVASPLSKPAHSPKMKLRYLKSVFPVVEETVLLDTLCSSDNNVSQATETLLTMGFSKRHNIVNVVPKLPRVTLTNSENDYDEDDMFWLRRKSCDYYDKTKSTCSSWPVSSVINLAPIKKFNLNEQRKIKQRLHEKFNDQEEKIIIFALESTDYNEVLADQILKNHLNNEFKTKDENDSILKNENPLHEVPNDNTIICEENISNLNAAIDNSHCGITTEIQKATLITSKSVLAKGPNKDLLSKKDSSKCDLLEKNRVKAKGPNKSLLSKIHSLAKGSNGELKKGPSKGLAKGSIFQRLFKK